MKTFLSPSYYFPVIRSYEIRLNVAVHTQNVTSIVAPGQQPREVDWDREVIKEEQLNTCPESGTVNITSLTRTIHTQ